MSLVANFFAPLTRSKAGKALVAFMAVAMMYLLTAAPSFAQAGGAVSDFQSNAVSVAGLAAALVVAVVIILSGVTLALWGLRKAGAGK